MGQPVIVVQKTSATPGLVRFEINRSLTGMGHERYRSLDDTHGDRPPDVLARRLFEAGGVRSVHVYSNVITVTLSGEKDPEAVRQLIEQLFIHYRNGVQPSIP